jgi:hypothetical protein
MAFTLKFTGIKWDTGIATAITIPGDIPRGEASTRDPRFREIPEDAGYQDFYAVLTPEEALEITHDGYEQLVEYWMKQNPECRAAADLGAMRTAIKSSDIVVANIMEWETGLGD